MYVLNTAYGTNTFESQVQIRSGAAFPLNPRSDVLYFIDGIVDFGSKPINVPTGGIYLAGHGNEISGITSSIDNYSLFTGATGGNIFFRSMFISIAGLNSKVFDVTSATGNEAIEFYEVNFNDCTSLGEITNYRQMLEFNTGRFGGTPELTLSGNINGYRITTSIVRGLNAGFAGSLFKAGTALSFSNRFLTDMNCDLPAGANVSDFSPSNFQAPSLVQISGGVFSRNGVISTGDNQLFTNLDPDDLVCVWKNNEGLRNTFEGGRITVSSETVTAISTVGTFYDIAGVWTADRLQHFSSPLNGRLQNDGTNPTEYKMFASLVLNGTANDSLKVRVVRWDDESQVFVSIRDQIATVNSLSGPRDVAIVTFSWRVEVNQNDYIKLQVSNASGTGDITAETGSYFELNL